MILVTGGTGFVGTALARSLVESDNPVRVVSLHKRSTAPVPNVQYVTADLCAISPDDQIFESVETIVHLASTTIPATSMADPALDAHTNIEMALRLLEAARRRGIRNFIFASSGGTVYGEPARLPVRETDATDPRSPYGIVKLAIEKYVGLYSHAYGLRGISLRVANPYGYGQFFGAPIGVIARLLDHAYHRTTFTLWGDGKVVRDYFHVDDLLGAFHVAIANHQLASGAYNVGSGNGIALTDLIALVEDITSRKLSVRYEAARWVDVQAIYLDTQKFRGATGWTTLIPLQDGVRALWQALLKKPPKEAGP